MPRESPSALRHDLIMVPAERRLQQRRQDIHPRLGGDYGPVVAHAGRLGLGCELPASRAAQVALGDAFQRRRSLDPGHAHGKKLSHGLGVAVVR